MFALAIFDNYSIEIVSGYYEEMELRIDCTPCYVKFHDDQKRKYWERPWTVSDSSSIRGVVEAILAHEERVHGRD